jgi:bacillithiol system protein YtxJ
MASIPINWIMLEEIRHFHELLEVSTQEPAVIFKHSSRCGLSSMKLQEIIGWHEHRKQVPVYFLNVIRFRSISDLIEDQCNVRHETPQVLVVSKGRSIYDEDHMRISGAMLDKLLENPDLYEASKNR